MINIFNKDIEPKEIISMVLHKLSELEKNNVIIQAQPLGMMRIALEGQKNAEKGLFLHYWAADLPKSMQTPPLHTHVFNLRSRVIVGKLTDITYKVTPNINGKFQEVQAKCTQDYCAITSSVQRVSVNTECIKEVSMGEIYDVPKGTYHVTKFNSEKDITITIMEKFDVDQTEPLLVTPYSANEIDLTPFDRMQLNQQDAWARIKKALNEALA